MYSWESCTELVTATPNLSTFCLSLSTYISSWGLEVQLSVAFQAIKKLRRNNQILSPLCVSPVRLILVKSSSLGQEASAIRGEVPSNTSVAPFKGSLWVKNRVFPDIAEERVLQGKKSE
jgi:hypothetical protein